MFLRISISVIGIIVAALLVLLSMAWDSLGSRPSEEDRKRFASSPQWKADRNVFDNRIPRLREKITERMSIRDIFRTLFDQSKDLVPNSPLPEIKPEMAEFIKPSESIKVVWYGHSTVLLNLGGKILLIDPVFSDYASPLKFAVKRFQPVVTGLGDLPRIDFIVISHDHYDHLDMMTIKHFVESNTKFIVPLGVDAHLKGWGVPADRIFVFDWWQSQTYDGLDFISTPAQHFSGRNGVTDGETLWTSWVIKNEKHNLYFSGDSGYDIHFEAIGKKYGPFDVAFLENGQYDKLWPEVHLLPINIPKAFEDLKAKRVFPIHWGMFKLAAHTWHEPITLLAKYTQEHDIPLISPKLGQAVEINDNYVNEDWWSSLRSEINENEE